MYPNFVKNLLRFVDLDEPEIQAVIRFIRPVNLKKKEYLLQAGQVCRGLYFVEKGCLRMFFINDKSAEQITQFALDGWWMADYFSFMDNKSSEYFIQAIEKSEVLAIDFSVFEQLLAEVPRMERYFRIIMQRALAASQVRTRLMFEMSKEEFYQHFATSFPEFIQRVPQYMVASYLGLTPEYVSELRRKKQ
jgi:cAMP-binding proteins - catabolite gene activator and regulatory subunit of cAMP-dependent protein kinases